jgi:hypothetical protein
MSAQFPRRDFLKLAAQATAVYGAANWPTVRAEELPPVRAITRGPLFHWFGYYDKLQFDPSSRYALGNQVGFEHRSPRPDDVIKAGLIDVEDGDRWTELGESRAWNWQQGCIQQSARQSQIMMLQTNREIASGSAQVFFSSENAN